MLFPKPVLIDKQNKLHAAHVVEHGDGKNNILLEEKKKPTDPE